jgi:opacity protein-like surface antigen
MHSVADLRAMVNANRTQFANVLAIAGLNNISSQVLDTLTTGNIIETSVAPNTHMEWMALKRSGTPGLLRNVRWVGQQPFDAFQITVEAAGYSYTFAVPKVCGNLALVSRTASPVVRRAEPAPRPAPAPPPAPVVHAAPPPPVIPTPPAKSGHYGWTATGFVGGYFAPGGEAPEASNISGSVTFGGQVAKTWGYFGAEGLADFAPKYHIDSVFLNSHPWVNSYMVNGIAIWPSHYVEPYFSAGIGGIQMHANVLPFFPGSVDNTSVYQTRFGWNFGAGAYAFGGSSIGIRGDIRYFQASTTNTITGTPPNVATEALLSGINFWRANVGVSFRW